MHIHILGICGTFMGGLALLARAGGHRVSGCDANVYPPMSTQLAQHGIDLIEGYDAGQMALAPDCYVIGNAISRGNPLLEAILDRGSPYVSGPQWLAENVLQGKWVLAVAGTHGKTTTAAMLAWMLEQAGLEPGFLIGGVPQDFACSARLSSSSFFVIEADEYDTAFCDKRSKFVHYRPRTLILNNLEFDHADIFPDLAAIEYQFHCLLRTVPASGRLIINGGEPALAEVLARGCWSDQVFFNHPGGWQVAVGSRPDEVVFLNQDAEMGRALLAMAGKHNQLNALAALLAAQHVGVLPACALVALEAFQGVKRRMEVSGSVAGVTVYDDFAHHPTALAQTLAGLRQRLKDGRILAVFEPRSNTMKQGLMRARLADSLHQADKVFCFTAGLTWDVTAALAPLGERARGYSVLEELVTAIVTEARPGDHVVIMSNGGFGGIHEQVLARLGSSSEILRART